MIETRIIADSLNPVGNRLTTYVLTYPRFIHSEVMTHRMFSRNASSSRAIPVKTMIDKVLANPASPISWGKNEKGMQSSKELCKEDRAKAILVWNEAMLDAVKHAKRMMDLGVHKQIVNRIIEPYSHITTILTGTEFNNFFNLRAHEDAQPEFEELAFQMVDAYLTSQPKWLCAGEWHLPFCDQYTDAHSIETLKKISTARCARVSYLNFEGNIDYAKDVVLHDDLMSSGHWSPFEHPAEALDNSDRYGNFTGYKQYRKFFSNENRTSFDAEERIKRRRSKL